MRFSFLLIVTALICSPVLSAQTCFPSENPALLLRVAVDQLRVRSQPNRDAHVRAQLPENSIVLWCGDISAGQDTVVLRGRPVVDYWYFVYADAPLNSFFDATAVGPNQLEGATIFLNDILNDQRQEPYSGWVFGGGLALCAIVFGEGQAFQPFDSPWATLTEIPLDSFRMDLYLAQHDTAARLPGQDSVLALPLDDGRTLFIEDTPRDYVGESQANYENLGYNAALGSYCIEGWYWEAQDITLISRANGDTLLVAPFSDPPCISPDGRHFFMPVSNYGGSNSHLALCRIDRPGALTPILYLLENQESGVLYPYWENAETVVYQSVDWASGGRKKAFRLQLWSLVGGMSKLH